MPRAAACVRSHFHAACEALAAILFPAPCRICSRSLDSGGAIPFCHSCLESLSQSLPEPFCGQCGRPIISTAVGEAVTAPRCHLCRNDVYHFDFVRSFGAYTPRMSRAILLLKYESVVPLGAWFARLMASLVQCESQALSADVVVPVPLDRGRLRERGYNQAELIARPLARLLCIPFRSYLLVRTRPRPSQLRLTRRERWETVRGAYAMHQEAQVDKARVLLVDDVFTTGATLDACSQALKGAGAARVVGLTVARALPQLPIPEAGLQDQDFGE